MLLPHSICIQSLFLIPNLVIFPFTSLGNFKISQSNAKKIM